MGRTYETIRDRSGRVVGKVGSNSIDRYQDVRDASGRQIGRYDRDRDETYYGGETAPRRGFFGGLFGR